MSRRFDGVDDVLNPGSPTALDDQEPFSITAWVYPFTYGEGSAGGILTKDSGGGYWDLFIEDGPPLGNLSFRKDFATTDLRVRSVGAALPLNTWTHVGLTWDGTANTGGVLMYINGFETTYSARTAGVGAKNSEATAPLFIGNRGVFSATWDGLLAHVAFYDRVLAPGEVEQTRQHPGSVASQQMIGYWTCNDTEGPESDYTSQSKNPATVTGALASQTYPPIAGMWGATCPQSVSF